MYSCDTALYRKWKKTDRQSILCVPRWEIILISNWVPAITTDTFTCYINFCMEKKRVNQETRRNWRLGRRSWGWGLNRRRSTKDKKDDKQALIRCILWYEWAKFTTVGRNLSKEDPHLTQPIWGEWSGCVRSLCYEPVLYSWPKLTLGTTGKNTTPEGEVYQGCLLYESCFHVHIYWGQRVQAVIDVPKFYITESASEMWKGHGHPPWFEWTALTMALCKCTLSVCLAREQIKINGVVIWWNVILTFQVKWLICTVNSWIV